MFYNTNQKPWITHLQMYFKYKIFTGTKSKNKKKQGTSIVMYTVVTNLKKACIMRSEMADKRGIVKNS